jgi:hypothetical protein
MTASGCELSLGATDPGEHSFAKLVEARGDAE